MTDLKKQATELDELAAKLRAEKGSFKVEVDELLSIDGFDEGTAGELQARARDYLEAANIKAMEVVWRHRVPWMA